jgi:signal transduction histidine kinase
MRLRTQIIVLLLLLGLAPLLGLATFTVPVILERLQGVLYNLHLQSLRASFTDLDEYMASRREMLRFLSKIPPPVLFRDEEGDADLAADIEQQRFVYWVNQLLKNPHDVYRVVYLDAFGEEQMRLERPAPGAPLVIRPIESPRGEGQQTLFEQTLTLSQDAVLIGPVGLGHSARLDVPAYLMLRMAAPVHFSDTVTADGAVLAFIDIGGLPRVFANILWVYEDGQYLAPHAENLSAFTDYPGLEALFARGNLNLWHGKNGKAVFWLPLLATDTGVGSVWVGRAVDVSEVEALRRTLWTHALIALVSIVGVIALSLRWITLKFSCFAGRLTEGIRRVLAGEPAVQFNLGKSLELREWASDLTKLAQAHEQASRVLHQRAQELEDSNRYKSEFLANMSHELRTPLQSILALSNLLAEDEDNRLAPEQIKQARIIHRAGSDLLQMIDDILDLSKIEAQKMTLSLAPCDIGEIVTSLLELFTPLTQRKGIGLVGSVEPGLPDALFSDGDKVRQILKNFLANAIKFTQRGAVRLRVRANPLEDAALRPLAFMVQDSGIGISVARQKWVFEAFRQADGSTRRKYGGTGLGLTISLKLAALLGGRIALESEEGAGASFYLLLPVKLDASDYPVELLEFTQSAEAPLDVDEGQAAERSVTPGAKLNFGVPDQLGRLLLLEAEPQRGLDLIKRCAARHWRVWVAENSTELDLLLAETTFAVVIYHQTPAAENLLARVRACLPTARCLGYTTEPAPTACATPLCEPWPVSEAALTALLEQQ